MSTNYVPKIVYGTGPTTITFDYPPSVDDGEERQAKRRVSQSLSGVEQVSLDYIEAVRTVTFKLITETTITALETFFDAHAALGSSFKYYTHATEVTYTEYTLKSDGLKKTKLAYKTSGFLYEVTLTLRRVIA